MKNKKGFTLVELLAVVSILSLLAIITLPNVVSMFNDAKKNSFITECKQIYKASEQEWIKDSIVETKEQIYSKCDSCTGKSLKLSGRNQINYFVKVDKSGKIVEFHVTDGTFQYSKAGKLLLNDIENVKSVSSLPDSDILNIDEEGSYYGTDPDCRYRIITETGSFSSDPNDKEICMRSIDRSFNYSASVLYSADSSYNHNFLVIPYKEWDFNDSSYIRIYEDNTKSHLIKEINKRSYFQERYNLYEGKFISQYTDWIDLGVFDRTKMYIEASDDIVNNTKYYYDSWNTDTRISRNRPINYLLLFSNTREGHRHVYESVNGPWISNQNVISKIKYFDEHYGGTYHNFRITNCPNGEHGDCGGNTYYVRFYQITL